MSSCSLEISIIHWLIARWEEHPTGMHGIHLTISWTLGEKGGDTELRKTAQCHQKRMSLQRNEQQFVPIQGIPQVLAINTKEEVGLLRRSKRITHSRMLWQEGRVIVLFGILLSAQELMKVEWESKTQTARERRLAVNDLYVAVMLKRTNMCSRKWASPGTSSGSQKWPTPTDMAAALFWKKISVRWVLSAWRTKARIWFAQNIFDWRNSFQQLDWLNWIT